MVAGEGAAVFEVFAAGGIFLVEQEGESAEFEFVVGGEPLHVGGVFHEGAANGTFVDADGLESGGLCIVECGECGGADSDNDDVLCFLETK